MTWTTHVPEALRDIDRLLIPKLEAAQDEGTEIQRQAYRGRIIVSNTIASREFLKSVGVRLIMKSDSQRIKETGSNLIQALIMEDGRAPNRPRPPIRAIFEWLPFRMIDQTLSNAFAIAISIGRKGIKPRRLAKKAFDDSKPGVIAAFERAVLKFLAGN